MKSLKRQINVTMEKYKEPEENLHRFSKLQILKNLSAYMEDFMEVLNFTIGDMEKHRDNVMDNSFQTSMVGEFNAARDFDFLLDSPSVKNL